MGIAHDIRVKMKYSSRVRLAAKQMYAHVQAGRSFEVPNGPGTDDLVVRSVLCLREMYPDVPVVYQARTIIIGRVDKTMKVGDEAWKNLEHGRYLPNAQITGNPEAFLADQAAWLASQGLNREEEIAEGQRRQAERDRIVMAGGSAAGVERGAVVKQPLTPEQVIEQEAERAMHRKALEDHKVRIADQLAKGVPMKRGEGTDMHQRFIDEPVVPVTEAPAPAPAPAPAAPTQE